MSSVDGVSLILIALAIDIPEVFLLRTLVRNYSDPPNMRCGGCKAAGIDREIWFYGEGENIGARLVRSGLLRRATAFARSRIVIRIGRRISPKRIPIRKTSYMEQERWAVRRARRRNQLTPTPANRALARRKSTRCTQFTAGSWRIFATFSLVFSRRREL